MKQHGNNTYKSIILIFFLVFFSIYCIAQNSQESLNQKRIQKKLNKTDSILNANQINNLITPSQTFSQPDSSLKAKKISYLKSVNNLSKSILTTGPEQDCYGAVSVCQQSYTQSLSYTGYGTTQEVYNSCLLIQESNSVWYIFTIQNNGTFGFNLNTSNDYDFALYDITTIGCSGIPGATPIRCNYSATYGSTGLTVPGATQVPSISYSASQAPTMSGISNAVVGQTFALVIDNFTGDNNGYTINFTGTAQIFDNTAPTMSTTATATCNTITVTFNEPILCSGLTLANVPFTISAPASITNIQGVNCTNNSTTTSAIITYTGATTTGSYHIGVNSNKLQDKCGKYMLNTQFADVNLLGTVSPTATPSTICKGSTSQLNANVVAGPTFSWAPSGTLNNATIVNPVATPLTTTTYTVSVTYNGCVKTSPVTVTVNNPPVVSINPMNPIICSNPTNLTASSVLNGSACGSCTYVWSNGPVTAANNNINGSGAPGTTYTVTVTSATGCTASLSSTIFLASSPPANTCNIYYVKPAATGTGDGLSPANACTIQTACASVLCSGATIKMSVGVYTLTNKIDINSNTTIEGGYNATFTTKTSDMSGGANSTTIQRNSTPDGGAGIRITAFNVASNATGFRFQDLRIEMPGGGTNPAVNGIGTTKTNYGIYLGTGCSNYKIVRCYIHAGVGANGATGANGTAAAVSGTAATAPVLNNNGTLTMGTPGTSAQGSNGGCGGLGGRSGVNGNNGYAGTGPGCVGGGGAGGSGTGVACGSTTAYGVDGADGVLGLLPSPLINPAIPAAFSYAAGYFVPGGTGATGLVGTEPTAGCGGGGGGYTSAGSSFWGGLGGAGGGAGKNGNGGAGGGPAGGAFGIFSLTSGVETNVLQCQITGSEGSPGVGGDGGAGSTGGQGSISTCGKKTDGSGVLCCFTRGGEGGKGGHGIYGGIGAYGAAGDYAAVGYLNGAVFSKPAFSSFALTGQPIIIAGDGTNSNTSCTGNNMNMTTVAPIPVWTFNSAPADGTNSGAGTPRTTTYPTTGKKDVIMATTTACPGAASPNNLTDYATVDAGCSTANGIESSITVSGYNSCTVNTANITVNLNITHTWDGDLIILLKAPNNNILELSRQNGGSGDNFTNTTFSDAAATNITAGTAPYTGSFKPQGTITASCSLTPTVTTFSGIGGGAYNPNGTWTLYVYDNAGSDDGTLLDWTLNLPVSSGGGSTPFTYTGFNNIITVPPSTGTINSSALGVCPGTAIPATFTSSLGNAPGYTFQWSMDANANVTPTFTAPTAYTTNVTFTNSSAVTQTVTIRLIVTSQCCGALAAVTKSFDIYPNVGTPTTSGNQSACTGGSATFTATGPAGASFSWYNVLSGGAALGYGSTYVVASTPAGVTNYYLEATSANGCISVPRTLVTVTGSQNTAPTANNNNICGPGTVIISVNAVANATNYNWYTGSCGGSLVQSGSSNFYSPNISSTTNFYVNYDIAGCTSSSLCATVVATINNVAPTSASWTGASSNDWFRASNWTLSGSPCIPGCGTTVTIPSVATNPAIGASPTYNPTGVPAVAGNLSIAAGATLNFLDNKGMLNICGNLVINGNGNVNMAPSGTGVGQISFNGTSAQTITISSASAAQFSTIEINNTSGGVKLMEGSSNKDLVLLSDGVINFNNGVLTTEGGKSIYVQNTASTAIGLNSISSYINGKLKRKVIAGTGTYSFPVGNTNAHERMDLVFNTVSGGLTEVTVWFDNRSDYAGTGWPITEPLGGQYTNSSSIINVGGTNATTGNSNPGMWVVLPNTGSATYNMTLFGRNYDNSGGGASFSILKRNTYECVSNLWVVDGTYNTSGSAGNVVSATRTSMSGFSKFALAKGTAALPVEMLYFDGSCNNITNEVTLTWITASEVNNNFFTIERSTNGTDFVFIAKVNGSGNTSAVNRYSYFDTEFPGGTCYYRLSQTDYDGHSVTINTKAVKCSTAIGFELINMIPNPAKNDLFVIFRNGVEEPVFITVYDVIGKELSSVKLISQSGINNKQLDMTDYSEGVYFIQISNGEKTFIKKIFK